MSFFEELKRRNVIKVALAYVVVAWLVMQFADVVLNNIQAPRWVFQAIMLVLGIGFALTLFFAWAFKMTPEGIKKGKDVDRSRSITKQTGRKLDFTIIGILALVAVYFVWESRFSAPDTGSEPFSETTVSQSVTAADQKRTLTPILENSIAVLPFANRSMQQEDLFFTDGIHDDLLTQLAKISDLKVISRTSMMKYRDTEMSIPEIAAELAVSTILEGGVQRAGKRIRINAQLIDAASDKHIWAETFDREMTMDNIFDIQSEITRQIVNAVRGELTEAERLNLARIPTSNLKAYEAYLQALALTNRADYSQENYIEAEIWAQKAVELDPEFAQGWAMLVEIHAQATWIGYDSSPERFEAARIARDNAVRLGPDLPETIAAQAEYQYRVEQNYKEAVGTFKAAHQALPGDVDILHRLAVAQRRAGYLEEAVDNFLLALELDPGHVRSPTTAIETLIFMNDFERAAKLADRWILKFPDARDLRVYRVQIYMEQGDLVSARALFDSMEPWLSSAYTIVATQLPMWERDYDRAITAWDIPVISALAGNRGFVGFKDTHIANAYAFMGNEPLSREYAQKAVDHILSLSPTGTNIDAFELQNLAFAYIRLGENEKALEASSKSRKLLPEDDDALFGSDVAQSHALLLGLAGKREESLLEIKRLLERPTGFNRWQLYLDPAWDFFRDDERFNELARPLNLEAAGQ